MNSIPKHPKIAWYPSAGNDYRDLMELCTSRAQEHGISEMPDLIIHTDYFRNWLNLEGTIYEDKKTKVIVEDRYELELTTETAFFVNPAYVDFPDEAEKEPLIYLLNISITSNILGIIKKPVIYFLFENINFLDEVILKNKIPVTYLVKVREGCGFGGNRKSISLVYAFLSALKTKYALIDTEEHTDLHIIDRLKSKHRLTLNKYNLTKLSPAFTWSGFDVNVFRITAPVDLLPDITLDDHELQTILNTIKDE